MATVAQIQANRLNAQKSTGPRTAAGKERACRNALKHGLLAREAVIAGEDPAEFEVYREGMLQELAPTGTVEAVLAERVVGLSWRLRRAERLQNVAFAALDEGEPTPVLEARHEEWKQVKGSDWDRGLAGVVDEDLALGRLVVADFAEARVLDRLLMYERRIESSLYRTMAELRREREARPAAAQEPVAPTELASFDLGATPKRSLSVSSAAQESPPDRHGQTSLSMPPTRVDRFSHSLSYSEGGLPAGQEPAPAAELGSFGANPVAEGGAGEVSSSKCQVSSGEEVSGGGSDSDFTLEPCEAVVRNEPNR